MVNVSDGAIANYAVWALPVRSTEVAPNVSSIMAAAMALAITTAPTKSVYPVKKSASITMASDGITPVKKISAAVDFGTVASRFYVPGLRSA